MSYLMDMLKRHEGVRLHPYIDTVGKTTIGVGRNLDDLGLSLEEVDFLLINDIERCRESLAKSSWFYRLNYARQDAILDMCFNLGITRFLEFQKMLKALEVGDWPTAAREMLESKWAKQVGDRAVELSEMIRTGDYRVSVGP
jgi:lysozyme